MCEKYEYKLKYVLTKVPSADFYHIILNERVSMGIYYRK